MLPIALDLLRCPVCAEPIELGDGMVRCGNGHSFDMARQGYLNLLPGRAHTGTADTAAMVTAREAFLGAGYFAPIADALVQAARSELAPDVPGCIVDIGAGTGYYAAAVLEALPGRLGLALDISKYAARRSARAHERLLSVVCDAWTTLPVRTGAAALVLDVFSPRNAAEFRRILAPGGALAVVTPTPRHLEQLVAALPMVSVDADKEERLEEKLGTLFRRTATERVERELALTRADVLALVAMGPSSRHVTPEELGARVALLQEPIAATLSVNVSVFRPA